MQQYFKVCPQLMAYVSLQWYSYRAEVGVGALPRSVMKAVIGSIIDEPTLWKVDVISA